MKSMDKRKLVGQRIDLGNGRFKEYELDSLIDFINDLGSYLGKSTSEKHSKTSFCSYGKYTRDSQQKYTVCEDEDGIFLMEEYSYQDDDGAHGESQREYRTARELLNLMYKIKRIKEGR